MGTLSLYNAMDVADLLGGPKFQSFVKASPYHSIDESTVEFTIPDNVAHKKINKIRIVTNETQGDYTMLFIRTLGTGRNRKDAILATHRNVQPEQLRNTFFEVCGPCGT